MPRMFETDGVRGLANRDLTAQLALDLGDAAVRVLGNNGNRGEFEGRRRRWLAVIREFPAIFLPQHCRRACLRAVSM